MAAMSNYLENALINEVLRATGYTAPTTVYVALFTSDPTDAGSGDAPTTVQALQPSRNIQAHCVHPQSNFGLLIIIIAPDTAST